MIWLFPTFFAALALGVPVAFSLGLAAVLYIAISGQVSLDVVPTVMFGGMDSFPLLAIPFFILAGDLAGRAGIMDRLVSFARALMGPLRGGLAHVNVGSSMLFGGVTGVAIADTAAVGSTLIPAMTREGYPRAFSAAVTAASSVMGAIIPPSVAMLIIVYIAGAGMSVTTLFLSGATPGILIGLGMMGWIALVARRRGFPGGTHRWSSSASKIDPLPVGRLPAFGMSGRSGDEGRGHDCAGSSGAFCSRSFDQGDQPGSAHVTQHGAQDPAQWRD
jgi:tripartite ATP-independent transporter DctM subunit